MNRILNHDKIKIISFPIHKCLYECLVTNLNETFNPIYNIFTFIFPNNKIIHWKNYKFHLTSKLTSARAVVLIECIAHMKKLPPKILNIIWHNYYITAAYICRYIWFYICFTITAVRIAPALAQHTSGHTSRARNDRSITSRARLFLAH